jgi:restriction system protein
VAELFNREGWEVILTPPSKDGGKDLYVAQKVGVGSFVYVVECKKYAPENPVGVSIVRALYGVAQAEKLAGGIVATTSYFTRGAREFQQAVKYQMSLADYVDLVQWIRRVFVDGSGAV